MKSSITDVALSRSVASGTRAALRSAKVALWATDRVLLAVLAILAALAWLDSAQLPISLSFVASAALKTGPFLLISVALAAYAKASGVDNLIARAFDGPVLKSVVAASLMGALSPFCSCGVIPIIVALLSMGVPLAPVMAFWLASPLMDPSMFVMTTATLGLEFALAKTVIAVAMGLLGGFGVHALVRSGWITQALKPGVGNGGCAGGKVRKPQAVQWAPWRFAARRQAALHSMRVNGWHLGKWLTLAFVLESLMLAYVPKDLMASLVGGSGIMPVLMATLIGVPSYLNGYAALPLVGALMSQGLQPAAGMAFLVAGGVTSLPAAMAVAAVADRRVFAAYLGLAFVGALSTAWLFGVWMA